MRFFIFKKVSNKERDRPRRSKKYRQCNHKSLLIQTRFAIRLDRRFLLDVKSSREKLYPNKKGVFINRTPK